MPSPTLAHLPRSAALTWRAAPKPAPDQSTGPQAACSSRLIGDSAFGKILSETGQFSSNASEVRSASMTVHAYFPTGRRPGASVLLAMPVKYPRAALSWGHPSGLDSQAGVDVAPGVGQFVGDELRGGFFGALVGPDQGLVGTAPMTSRLATTPATWLPARSRCVPRAMCPRPT